MTMRPGLVSISFRQLSVEEILEGAASAGLGCIEWGGDIHVPHGDMGKAREAGRWTREAGLAVTAYGSYFRLGSDRPDNPPFGKVLDTAVALGAPVIRIWAGTRGSKEADEAYWLRVAEEAREAAGLARQAGLRLAYEMHANSLTDSVAAVAALLEAARHPAIGCLWQPSVGGSLESDQECLAAVLARLEHVHVFHWWPDGRRRPLAEGRARWSRYLEALRAADKHPDLLLEFLPDDNPALLIREAETLREWLREETPQLARALEPIS